MTTTPTNNPSTVNWDDPSARADLIQRAGVSEYERQFTQHRKASVVATVCGYEIRPVMTRFGRLYQVGATGRAFSTLPDAEAFARAVSHSGAQP